MLSWADLQKWNLCQVLGNRISVFVFSACFNLLNRYIFRLDDLGQGSSSSKKDS